MQPIAHGRPSFNQNPLRVLCGPKRRGFGYLCIAEVSETTVGADGIRDDGL